MPAPRLASPEPLPATIPLARPANPHGAAALPSSTLLNGQKSVLIEHQGLIYRLQETKLGKLILTK